ncbi:unnamed protein product [Acanthoscelides obtectus]|uniref:Uncharacterized protein n=1 Tax=Acanthoscelides obtectus TaxID=200917 RepID=A0A9P0LPM9_ACAOB|nr:unnamed protein product [Acanthoscelides obtectus]CAK1634025.1 hypothetical protein AOBTE_LOCUS8545 [Acanthoscelides obtectus]
MKEKWRKILSEWKASSYGSRVSSIPKDELLRLLKSLMNQLSEKAPDNLKSGFRKTGICPLDRQVLDRLCDRVVTADTEITEHVGNSFIQHITNVRTETTKKRQVKRRKRLNVPPGKSICGSDFNNDTLTVENMTKTVDPESGTSDIRQRKRLRYIGADRSSSDSSSENEDEVKYMESDDSTSDDHFFDDGDEQPTEENNAPSQKVEKSTGRYVVVQFEQNYFPCQITNVSRVGATINVMERAGKQCKWPLKKDEIFYRKDEIVMGINAPMQRGKRALFDVPELKDILE